MNKLDALRFSRLQIVLACILLLSACTTNNSTSESGNGQISIPKEISLGQLDVSQSLSLNYAYPYEDEIPGFPAMIPNYILETQSIPESVRLFQGDEWKIPIKEFNPEAGGGATMSCEPYYWILRWRSDNPDLEINVSTGLTDGPYDPFDNVTSGGVGVSEGFSCAVPAFKFRGALNESLGNLVDVNFEYQIWKYKPKI